MLAASPRQAEPETQRQEQEVATPCPTRSSRCGEVDHEAADRQLRQHEHDDQRRVGVLGLDRGSGPPAGRSSTAGGSTGSGSSAGCSPGRARSAGNRSPRRSRRRLGAIDDPDADRLVRAGLDARRRLADLEPIAAHVALADDPLARVELGGVVGAGERAVLAAEALVVEVLDDPRDRVLLVGIDRAGVQAGRVEAVVAGRRDVLEDRQARRRRRRSGRRRARLRPRPGRSAHGRPPRTPCSPSSGRGRPRRRTAARARGAGRQQGRVVSALERLGCVLVELREPLDGGQVALLVQQGVDQRPVRHPIRGSERIRHIQDGRRGKRSCNIHKRRSLPWPRPRCGRGLIAARVTRG